ncbi:MAG: HDIG domain-containing protein [Nitrospirota bacterium]|nr:HDIG domain-containing protein [Nitrospirota bacterium]
MTYRGIDADIEILRKAGVSEADIVHSKKVSDKAIDIAVRTGAELSMDLIARGALFHDLGKAKTHDMDHGKIGAEIGKDLGLPKALTDIMEKHIRGGLTESEAKELNLPIKDYTLRKLEERIVIYADRLVDIITDGIVEIRDEKEAEARFEEILKSIPKYGKNELTLQRYLRYHQEIQGLIENRGEAG